MAINILCIGDVVGSPGRGIIVEKLPGLIRDRQLDLVICNAENAASGSGLTPTIFDQLLRCGVDVVTLGDHVYKRREICARLQLSDHIVRPANISPKAIGKRWTVVPTKSGQHQVAVCCLLGRLYMNPADSPWEAVDAIVREIPEAVKVRVLDFHAEATGEKIAMGWFCAGRMSLVFGTHTHIPTADARVLEGGTGYITDVGMTGPYDSVLGRCKDRVLHALTTSMPTPFDVATQDVRLCGVLASIDETTGKALSVERVEICGTAKPAPAEGKADGAAIPAEQAQAEEAAKD